jgi:hypothetical protein
MRWVPAIGVIPDAVGPSGKRLDPALDEGTDDLDARQLLLGRSPKLLDFL